MSTDSNSWDSFLKEKLYRDLVFRGVIWALISAAAGYHAITYLNITELDYFDRIGKSIGSLVNIFGSISFLICIPALMLKDLEATLTDPSKIAITRGLFCGAIRRLAGDLSLWTLGALTSMLTTLVIVTSRIDMTSSEYAAIGALGLLLLFIMIFIALANIYVRRAGPTPLIKGTENPLNIAFRYVAVILVILFGMWLFPSA